MKTKLMERKICFIWEVGNLGGGQIPVQRSVPTLAPVTDNQWAGDFIDRRGLQVKTIQLALIVILKLVIFRLTVSS